MNWKRLALFDLRRLIPGVSPLPDDEDPCDLWFVALFGLLTGRRRQRPGRLKRAVIDDATYRPGRYYRTRGRRWRGPFYITAARWRRDLLYVVDQLAAITRTNASLTKGLEAVAKEERRLNTQLTAKHLYALAQAAGAMAAVLAVGLAVGSGLFDRFDTGPFVLYFLFIAVLAMIPAIFILNRSGRVEAVFLTLRDSLSAGAPLSESMSRLRRFFPRFYVDMVKAGEDSGRLAGCIEQLGEESLRCITLAQALRLNLLYLGFVFSIQALLVSFIAVKILPVFADIFREFGCQLPKPTLIVMGVGDWLAGYGYAAWHPHHGSGGPSAGSWWGPVTVFGPILLIIVSIALAKRLRRRRGLTARPLTSFFLLIPGVRGLLIKQNLATIAVILEKLLAAGVPLDQALDSAAKADVNPMYAESVRRLRKHIMQGETLAAACDAEAHLPPIPKSFRGLVSIGEQSGMLPQALARISQFYQAQADKRSRIIVDTLLPFGVIGLGYLTLMIELALFLTLTGLVDTFTSTM